jgi:hypothetical protein
MERLTTKFEKGEKYLLKKEFVIACESGFSGEAAEKLAKFENFYEELFASQEILGKELDKLRSEGKEKSTKFRELFTKKLMNNSILILLKSYGLE